MGYPCRVKRQPRLTKREKKAIAGPAQPSAQADHHHHQHIHCTACGRHLDEHEFEAPKTAEWVNCKHGSTFSSCTACVEVTKKLLDEHDRTGKPVNAAPAYH